MKYNPRGAHRAASIPGFLARHPLRQNRLARISGLLYELQQELAEVTGMQGVSLTPWQVLKVSSPAWP